MTTQTSSAVPEYYAQRFAKAFEEFVAQLRASVDAGKIDPAYSATPALLMWQTEALPRLERELVEVQNEFARFLLGETNSIALIARNKLGLAKQLDGFPLDFAGPEHAKVIDRLETAVVLAAYPVCQAAGIR